MLELSDHQVTVLHFTQSDWLSLESEEYLYLSFKLSGKDSTGLKPSALSKAKCFTCLFHKVVIHN